MTRHKTTARETKTSHDRAAAQLCSEQSRFFPIEVIAESLAATYQRLSEIPDPKLPVKYPRTPGYRPVGEDNPDNAWQVNTLLSFLSLIVFVRNVIFLIIF